MTSYPTPPPTISPTHTSSQQPFPSTRPADEIRKIPAQESYFHSYSAPSSPIQSTPLQNAPFAAYPEGFDPSQPQSQPQPQPQSNPHRPPPQHSNTYPLPPRRRSSPTPYTRPPKPLSPRPFSPRPLHFSPSNPAPTPYSASRPQPRPGFIKRILGKIEEWIRAFMRWSKRNPMVAGLVTFIPVLATAGVVKIARGVGKGLGIVEKGYGRTKVGGGEGLLRGIMKDGKKVGRGGVGVGLDGFMGFGAAKKDAGPLEGLLKMVRGLV